MARERRRRGRRGSQADNVMHLIREGTAVQVELLGAAARVLERHRRASGELQPRAHKQATLKFSAGETNANDSLELLVRTGKRHVQEFTNLPEQIGETFKRRVRDRARVGRPTAR